MCILCVRVKINRRSFEPFCVWIYIVFRFCEEDLCVLMTRCISISTIVQIHLLVDGFCCCCFCCCCVFCLFVFVLFVFIPSASFPVPCTKIDVNMFEWAFFYRSVSLRTVSAICYEREHMKGGPAVCSGLGGPVSGLLHYVPTQFFSSYQSA